MFKVQEDKNCADVTKKATMPDVEFELAQAYVPVQNVSCLYSPQESLQRGTVFPELDKTYKAKKQPCHCKQEVTDHV